MFYEKLVMSQHQTMTKRNQKYRFVKKKNKVWIVLFNLSFPGGSDGNESICNVGDCIQPLVWEDPLKEDIATHSSILVCRIPMDRGAWWATVHRVTKSQT